MLYLPQMDDEIEKNGSSHFFYAILVFVFVWGSLWVSTSGVSIARNYEKINTQHANVSGTDNIVSIPTIISPTPTPEPQPSITIMIGGDLMLDRGIRLVGEKYGYNSLFATATPIFEQADIVVANLEGPITSNKSKTVLANGKTGKELIFTFSPKSAKAIASSSIDIVSLANNHTDNFGIRGLKETKKWLGSVGIKWFGDPANASSTGLVINKNEMKIAFVGYHAFRKGFERTLEEISSLSEQGNFVIVMPHWGEEYATSSSVLIRSQAREMITAGAKAIIGAHPHVVLDRVWMGDVPVIYSLGNLLFDQHFSPEVMRGNIAELKLVKTNGVVKIDKVRIYETSIASKRGIGINMDPVDF